MFDVMASSFMTAARTETVARSEFSSDQRRESDPNDRVPAQRGLPEKTWGTALILLLSASL